MAIPEVAPKARCETDTADLPGNKKEEKEKTMTESQFETLKEFTTVLDKKVEVSFAEIKGEIKLIDKKIDLKIDGMNKQFGILQSMAVLILAGVIGAVIKLFLPN